jgi:dUTP pyrophosphatase
MNQLKVKKLNENGKLPLRSNSTDAGLDLFASESVFIPHGSTAIVPTGISIETPSGYVSKIEDRSSMAAKGLRTGAGVVDSGYTGEIKVVIHNFSNKDGSMSMNRGYVVNKGDKIAQLLIYKVETPTTVEVQELGQSDRGFKGFGQSSGR